MSHVPTLPTANLVFCSTPRPLTSPPALPVLPTATNALCRAKAKLFATNAHRDIKLNMVDVCPANLIAKNAQDYSLADVPYVLLDSTSLTVTLRTAVCLVLSTVPPAIMKSYACLAHLGDTISSVGCACSGESPTVTCWRM